MKKINKFTHSDLCKRTAERFVKTMAIYESTMLSYEKPDVLNFDSSGNSWLYEIKMSRSDFLADKNKYARKSIEHGQFGDYRYFVCYGDFIKPNEVPDGWGLYHFINNKFYKIKESEHFINGIERRFVRNTQLLINFIICERTNVIFAKRVLETRERYKNKREGKNDTNKN